VASVLHQTRGGATRLLAVVEQDAGRILELDVPDTYAPRALRDFAAPVNSIVGAIVRGSQALVPRGTDRAGRPPDCVYDLRRRRSRARLLRRSEGSNHQY
jgi:hypothetical protein